MRSLGFVGLALAFSLASCDPAAPTEPAEQPLPVLMSEPESVGMDPAKILEARIEGDILTLKVSHGGGCRQHESGLLYSGVLMKSLPPQTYLTLLHDANGDACEALLTADLAFDLAPLRAAYSAVFTPHGTLVIHLRAPGSPGSVAATVVYTF